MPDVSLSLLCEAAFMSIAKKFVTFPGQSSVKGRLTSTSLHFGRTLFSPEQHCCCSFGEFDDE